MPQNSCPNCKGLKDIRAKLCQRCQTILYPNKKGTGKGWYISKQNNVKIVLHNNKWKWESRAIMEDYLKCILEDTWEVHHRDENRLNNSLDNLQLVTKSEHRSIHNRLNNPMRTSKNVRNWRKSRCLHCTI